MGIYFYLTQVSAHLVKFWPRASAVCIALNLAHRKKKHCKLDGYPSTCFVVCRQRTWYLITLPVLSVRSSTFLGSWGKRMGSTARGGVSVIYISDTGRNSRYTPTSTLFARVFGGADMELVWDNHEQTWATISRTVCGLTNRCPQFELDSAFASASPIYLVYSAKEAFWNGYETKQSNWGNTQSNFHVATKLRQKRGSTLSFKHEASWLAWQRCASERWNKNSADLLETRTSAVIIHEMTNWEFGTFN